MRVPAERRAELHAEALQRIARSGDNDWRRFLLAECLEAYSQLDEAQKQALQALLNSEAFKEAKPLMMTTFERGHIEGERKMALLLLEEKFGPLPPTVKERVAALSPEQLHQLMRDFVKAQTLKELNLED